MDRHSKQVLLHKLESLLLECEFCVFLNFSAISAPEMTSLRKELVANKGNMIVAKCSLLRMAMGKFSEFSAFVVRVSGPTAVLYVKNSEDLVLCVKVIVEFAKVNKDRLTIGFGICRGLGVLESPDVVRLASLPTLQEMRMQITSLVGMSVQTSLLRVISAPAAGLIRLGSHISVGGSDAASD